MFSNNTVKPIKLTNCKKKFTSVLILGQFFFCKSALLMRKQIHCYIRGGGSKNKSKSKPQASKIGTRISNTYISFYYQRTCLLNKNDVFKLAKLWVRYFCSPNNIHVQGICVPKSNPFAFWCFCQKKGGDLHQRWWTKNKLNCLSLGSHWSQKTNQICIPFSKACLLLKPRLCYLKISFSFEVFWVQRQAHFHYNLLSTFLSNSFLCWDWH